MIRLLQYLCARIAAIWAVTDPKQPLPFPKPFRSKEWFRQAREMLERMFRIDKPEQFAPNVFDGFGYVAFHRHSDGVPVAVAKCHAFIKPPEGCYTVPLASWDVSLYRCTLPELYPTA